MPNTRGRIGVRGCMGFRGGIRDPFHPLDRPEQVHGRWTRRREKVAQRLEAAQEVDRRALIPPLHRSAYCPP